MVNNTVDYHHVDNEYDSVKTFVARQADAIIVTGFTHTPACVELLTRFHGPVVETWNLRDDAIDKCVGYDNYEASKAMTRYLIKKGYREIAMVGGAFENNDQAVDRRDGFLASMDDAGRNVRPEFIVSVPNPTTIQSGRDALISLMSGNCKPDAIFFQAEIPAHGALMASVSQGIAIPDDVAIAGFGDLSLSKHMPVPLTTVRIRAHEIGRQTAELVLAELDGTAQPTSESGVNGMGRIDVGFEIIERESA